MQHRWESDESLLDDLQDALTPPAESVPPEFIEAARAAFTWRTIDAELLLLTSYDSVMDTELAARARATMTARQLVFDAEGLSMQIEVTEDGIVGQVMPPRQGAVTLLTPTGPGEETTTDELGCFLMGPPPNGPIRFRLDTVLTDWVCI